MLQSKVIVSMYSFSYFATFHWCFHQLYLYGGSMNSALLRISSQLRFSVLPLLLEVGPGGVLLPQKPAKVTTSRVSFVFRAWLIHIYQNSTGVDGLELTEKTRPHLRPPQTRTSIKPHPHFPQRDCVAMHPRRRARDTLTFEAAGSTSLWRCRAELKWFFGGCPSWQWVTMGMSDRWEGVGGWGMMGNGQKRERDSV